MAEMLRYSGKTSCLSRHVILMRQKLRVSKHNNGNHLLFQNLIPFFDSAASAGMILIQVRNGGKK